MVRIRRINDSFLWSFIFACHFIVKSQGKEREKLFVRQRISSFALVHSFHLSTVFDENFYQKHNRYISFSLFLFLFSFCSQQVTYVFEYAVKEQIYAHTHIRLHTLRWHTLLTIEILLPISKKIILQIGTNKHLEVKTKSSSIGN